MKWNSSTNIRWHLFASKNPKKKDEDWKCLSKFMHFEDSEASEFFAISNMHLKFLLYADVVETKYT